MNQNPRIMNNPETPFVDRRQRSEPADGPVHAPCHACRETISLRLERLELVENRVFHQYPLCDAWSLIRSTDLHLLLERGDWMGSDGQSRLAAENEAAVRALVTQGTRGVMAGRPRRNRYSEGRS